MESTAAVAALSALAQDRRLAVFRLLVVAGPAGAAASEIASRLEIPPPTLTFHLKELANAGLVRSRRAGRFLFYSADFSAMNALLHYLTENCCEGVACAPAPATVSDRRPAHRARGGKR
jgi:DNA-binding transcriptional ArsR family regulator